MSEEFFGKKSKRSGQTGPAFPIVEERRPLLKVFAAVGLSMLGAVAVIMVDRPATGDHSTEQAKPHPQGKASRLDQQPSRTEQAKAVPPSDPELSAAPADSADDNNAASAGTNKNSELPLRREALANASAANESPQDAPAEPRADEIWPAPAETAGFSPSPPKQDWPTANAFSKPPQTPARPPAVASTTANSPTAAAQPNADVAPKTAKPRAQAASDGCLVEPARRILASVQSQFSGVTVISTTHLHTDNHSPGSAREKLHHACKAVDFKSSSAQGAITAFLRKQPGIGGVNSYRNGVIHFDVLAASAARAQRHGSHQRARAAPNPTAEAPAPALGFVQEEQSPGGN